ncbi:hypothetical protein RclHR1_04360020 [Rhizophagus clarus]|nr:hypothetical protein RclHR1_04360020 [Rhizophagus clarus]
MDAIINLTDNENEEIKKNKHLRADSDSGKIEREKVLRYLESMQSNLNTVFFKTIEGEYLQPDPLFQHQHHHPNAIFI